MRKTTIIGLLLIAASFVLGLYFYPRMPQEMASHWNTTGEVDDYMAKSWGLFLMPAVSLLMLLVFLVLPKIDPLKDNYKKFRKYYDGLILALIIFLFYINLLSLAWNLGCRFNMTTMLLPALGILFYYTGVLLENAKRNWFVGIRTPWTLASETVWEKTHALGGKMFKAAGALALLGIIFQGYAMYFLLAPVIFTALYTLVYSYLEYRKLEK